MNERHDDLFDEIRLRRALRLEAAELPPRLDVAAIAARAATPDAASRTAGVLNTLIAAFAAAALVAVATVALVVQAPVLLAGWLDDAIVLVARLAVPADGALGLMQEPTVPVTVLAAVLFATAYELVLRRERRRALGAA